MNHTAPRRGKTAAPGKIDSTFSGFALAARSVILGWLERKSGTKLPPAAWNGEAFALSPDQGQVVEAISYSDPSVWASLLVDPDRNVAGRNWIVEVALFESEHRARLVMRLSCAARGELGDFIPAVPSFVRTLIREIGLGSGDYILNDTYIQVDSDDDLEDLIAFVEDSRRRLPVIVLSEVEAGHEFRWLLDATALARNLAGLAVVYRLPYERAYRLTDSLGKAWSVFQGACRMYRPGFDRRSQTPYDHPLLLGHRLEGSEGAFWGLEWLCREAARISVERADIYARLPRFRDIDATFARLETERRLQVETAPLTRMPLLERENAILKGQIDEALQQSVEIDEEARLARGDLDESRRLNAKLQAKIEALEAVVQSNNQVVTAAIRPASYSEIPAWVEDSFPDRLALSTKARRAVVDSVYQDLALVCDALEALAYQYVDMRRYGGREGFDSRLRELHVRDEAISATPDKLKKDAQYWCRHEGRQVFTDRHIKKSNSREPHECLRIYYAWDEDTRQVVVGHLTTHLVTEIS